MVRVLMLRWTPADYKARKEAQGLAQRFLSADGWTHLIEWRGLILLHRADAASPLIASEDTSAQIFGSLFHRAQAGDAAPVTMLTRPEAYALAESAGRRLIDEYWGGYIGVLTDRGRDFIHVVRDPTGLFPFYRAKLGSLHVAFSDIRDFAAVGGDLNIRSERVAGFLLQPRLATHETGVEGVYEVRPGECLTFTRDEVRSDILWRPWAPNREIIDNFEIARERLGETVNASVRAWTHGQSKIALRLSGGLDSSIVLAALAKTEAEIVCVNEYSAAAPEGDERAFAKAAAERAGKAFLALHIRPEAVKLERLFDAPLFPSPTRTSTDWANREFAESIWDLGAGLVLSGQAGDHVFHRVRTPLIAADAARAGLRGKEWRRVAFDTAYASGKSIWEIWNAALRHGHLREALDLLQMWKRSRQLSAPSAQHAPLSAFAAHPWLENWRQWPAGRTLRVALLLDALHYNDPNLLRESVQAVAPLFSQPLIELSLAIPAWVMTKGGVDRALARAAFAEHLPPEILSRSTKGETTRYFAALIGANREVLADTLLNGRLVALGLIDAPAMEQALTTPPANAEIVKEIINCFVAEAWLTGMASSAQKKRA